MTVPDDGDADDNLRLMTLLESCLYALSFQIAEVCKKQRKDYMHIKTIDQCLRSSSSVAANIQEALASQSNKMILSKLYISLREAKETNFWIEKFQHDKIISDIEQHSLKTQCNQVIRELYAFIKFIKKRG